MDSDGRNSGRLLVVGTGISAPAHISLETKSAIETADIVHYGVADPVTEKWIIDHAKNARSLSDEYSADRTLFETYESMVGRIFHSVCNDQNVCAAFYGHPGMFVYAGHQAIKRATEAGYDAKMLPSISALDCLFADLAIDPSTTGCQMYEATEFVLRTRKPDQGSYLILWQIAHIGEITFSEETQNPQALTILRDYLSLYFDRSHELILYEASSYPICLPRIERIKLSKLAKFEIEKTMTLVVPPCIIPEVNDEMKKEILLRTQR